MAYVCVCMSVCVSQLPQVVAHMMPDLPNVGLERDIEQFIVSCSYSYNVIPINI